MLIDHITALFIPFPSIWYVVGRSIGRLSFPIFCFLIVEGLFRTSNLKRYVLRLSLFALISEIPFDFVWGEPHFLDMQNVFFTLLIGLCTAALLQYIYQRQLPPLIYNLGGAALIVAACMLADFIRSDYSSYGVVGILIFYFFRGKKLQLILAMGVWVFLFYIGGNQLQIFSILSLVPIFCFNGMKGRTLKYAFYVFYPLHLLLLGGINLL